MRKIFTIISLLMLCCLAYAANNEKVYLTVEIFQTLDKNSALARNSDWNVVKIQTKNDIYYDGKKISDYFVFVDTYSYETTNGITKTVPVYIRQSELNNTEQSCKRECVQLSLEVFQTLNNHIALARTSDYLVVRIDSNEETFYDGKKLTGKFVLLDTYSYETKNGTFKTVPVYAKESELNGITTKEKGEQILSLSVEIFQTLSKNEALARTKEWDVVKLETNEDVYYDGKKISGSFVLIGTYNYTTKNDIEKTVPVYMRESEYKKIMSL